MSGTTTVIPLNATNVFSDLKAGATLLHSSWRFPALSSPGRRVTSSASNFARGAFQRMTQGPAIGRARTAGNAVLEGGSNALGVMSTGASVAAAVGCTVAFTAAMSGPQAGIALGLIGLAVMAKNSYSNREAAHDVIQPYVWTLVDTKAPKAFPSGTELDTLVGACMALQDDGKSQFELLEQKYNQRRVIFETHMKKITDAIQERDRLNGLQLAGGGTISHDTEMDKLERKAIELYRDGIKPGGPIWEFVRRCCHMSNYLQAPAIIAIGVKQKLVPGSANDYDFSGKDFFANSNLAGIREMFFKIDDILKNYSLLGRP